MLSHIKKHKNQIFIILLICITLAISYFFPSAHDDWAWGSSIGIERLNSLFENYNGRWMGNILVILLTRNRLLRAITITATFVLFVYFINKFFANKKFIKYIIILLLITIPINVFAQSIAWVAGFANYVIPALIALIYLYINRNVFNRQEVVLNNKFSIVYLVSGFVSCLFVEHMTIYFVVTSLFMSIIVSIKNKKASLCNILFFIGCVMGTILMFSNSAYHNIANNVDTYRTMANDNIIITAVDTYFKDFYKLFIHQNIIMNFVLGISALLLTKKRVISTDNKIKKVIIVLSKIIVLGYLFYITYTRILNGGNIFVYNDIINYIEGIMVIVFLLSLLCIVIISIKDLEIKKRIIFEMFSVVIMAAPLLVVNPIGPRCFFPIYIFLILIATEFLSLILKNNINKYLFILYCLIGYGFISLFSIYGYMFYVDVQREAYINQNKNQIHLRLPLLPNENYSQFPNPATDSFEERFKKFYNIPEKTTLEFVPYYEWKK